MFIVEYHPPFKTTSRNCVLSFNKYFTNNHYKTIPLCTVYSKCIIIKYLQVQNIRSITIVQTSM